MDMNQAERRAVLGVVGEHRVNAFEADQRVVHFDGLGGARATLIGERRSAAARQIADATDGILKRLVDRELPEGTAGTKNEPYERYMVADRILTALGALAE
jgi:hypothetical protein